MKVGSGAAPARVVRSHAPGRPRDPTGRHDDRSAGSLLDWDFATRITPGARQVPGSADLRPVLGGPRITLRNREMILRSAPFARDGGGAPRGAAFSLPVRFVSAGRRDERARYERLRFPALRSLGLAPRLKKRGRTPRRPNNRGNPACLESPAV